MNYTYYNNNIEKIVEWRELENAPHRSCVNEAGFLLSRKGGRRRGVVRKCGWGTGGDT